jgi:transposase InsO family protein
MDEEKRQISRKLRVLDHAKETHNVSQTCRYFGISRKTYYEWLNSYQQNGENGLINKKPCPINMPLRTPPDIEEKIIHIRKNYYFGQQRISSYLLRYHGIKIAASTVHMVLVRNGLNLLPKNQRLRTIKSRYKRYEKQVPGHRIQVDVKFLNFVDGNNNKIKRYQYTAIDDATRIRALKTYKRHNQSSAIDFIDYVVKKFPFRIHTIQTDNGPEFQSKFHWHVEDLGIRHVYIKPRTPHLNGKVERSHSTDKDEFYQLMEYTDDVDLNEKLQEWENFYNYQRPHSGLKGKTPYEILREKISPKGVT